MINGAKIGFGLGVALCLGLLACEDPNRAPPKPTYLDTERELIRQNLPFAPGSPGGASLESRLAHHQVAALALGLVEGGEIRFVIPVGQRDGQAVTAATPFDSSSLLDLLLALGIRRLAQDQTQAPDLGAKPDLAALLAAQPAEDPQVWLPREIFKPAKLAHSTLTGQGASLRWQASATDLAALIVDLQKAVAGRPGRSLKQAAALELTRTGETGLASVFGVRGKGQATYFDRREAGPAGSVWLRGFISSGQGLVILTDAPHGLTLSEEIATAIAEVYHWPRAAD